MSIRSEVSCSHRGYNEDCCLLECDAISLVYCYRRFGGTLSSIFMILITLYHTTRRLVAEDNFQVCKNLREVEAIKLESYVRIVVKDIHATQFLAMKIFFSWECVIPK
jgi:hypothetical protein